MRRVRLVVGLALVGLVLLLGVLYVGDDLLVRYRVAHRVDRDPFDQVTYYIATPLKNGRVEVFYDQPQTEVCVHALFPHLGRRPCWYARRQRIHYAGAKMPVEA